MAAFGALQLPAPRWLPGAVALRQPPALGPGQLLPLPRAALLGGQRSGGPRRHRAARGDGARAGPGPQSLVAGAVIAAAVSALRSSGPERRRRWLEKEHSGELRAICVGLRLRTRGTRPELVARIEDALEEEDALRSPDKPLGRMVQAFGRLSQLGHRVVAQLLAARWRAWELRNVCRPLRLSTAGSKAVLAGRIAEELTALTPVQNAEAFWPYGHSSSRLPDEQQDEQLEEWPYAALAGDPEVEASLASEELEECEVVAEPLEVELEEPEEAWPYARPPASQVDPSIYSPYPSASTSETAYEAEVVTPSSGRGGSWSAAWPGGADAPDGVTATRAVQDCEEEALDRRRRRLMKRRERLASYITEEFARIPTAAREWEDNEEEADFAQWAQPSAAYAQG